MHASSCASTEYPYIVFDATTSILAVRHLERKSLWDCFHVGWSGSHKSARPHVAEASRQSQLEGDGGREDQRTRLARKVVPRAV